MCGRSNKMKENHYIWEDWGTVGRKKYYRQQNSF